MVEDLDVLASGMEHLDHARVAQQRKQRLEIDVGHRIDNRLDAGGSELDQAQPRPIGLVAHELRIDGDIGLI